MDTMLRQALRRHRELRNQFENCLLGEEGDKWEREARNFLAKRPCWINSQVAPVAKSRSDNLLQPLDSIIIIPATVWRFVVRDRFKVDTALTAELPISHLGGTFRKNFLAKIEEPMLGTKLRPHQLQRPEVDGSITKALGGNDKAETTLREMHHFLKSADRTKGYLFYIRDAEYILWSIWSIWNEDGWSLDTYSDQNPYWCPAGYLVVARC